MRCTIENFRVTVKTFCIATMARPLKLFRCLNAWLSVAILLFEVECSFTANSFYGAMIYKYLCVYNAFLLKISTHLTHPCCVPLFQTFSYVARANFRANFRRSLLPSIFRSFRSRYLCDCDFNYDILFRALFPQ
jgi:hypothetical protein